MDTLWDSGEAARKMGMWFRSKTVINALSFLAFLDMVLCVFTKPGLKGAPDGVKIFGVVCQIIIWLIQSVCLGLRLKYMWRSRSRWFKTPLLLPYMDVKPSILLPIVF